MPVAYLNVVTANSDTLVIPGTNFNSQRGRADSGASQRSTSNAISTVAVNND